MAGARFAKPATSSSKAARSAASPKVMNDTRPADWAEISTATAASNDMARIIVMT
jgi:hypothetical protein